MSSTEEIVRDEAEDYQREQEAREAAFAEGVDPETGEVGAPARQFVPPSTQTQLEKMDKQLTSENTRHENALKRIYGDSFDQRVRCPVCEGEGWPLSGEELISMMVALGDQAREVLGTAADGYNHPDELIACARCSGQGQVATGARNEHNAVILCKLCEGRGFFDTSDAMHQSRLNPPKPVDLTPIQFTPPYGMQAPSTVEALRPPDAWHAQGSPGADTWGRWPGHPRYGIDPSTSPAGW